MFTFENQAAVNFVAQHHDIATADRAGDVDNVLFLQDAAGRILRRIQNDELGPVIDQPGELVHVEPKIQLLAQPNRHRFRADVVNHRLVNRESGIGIDHLVPFFRQRQAVHCVTPTCSSHLERLTTAAPFG